MHGNQRRVLTGTHFMLGNFAVVEGALAAGCNFFAGYPITPANEISERMAERMPQVGGKFLQGEDELCSIFALTGASLAGAKVMTAAKLTGPFEPNALLSDDPISKGRFAFTPVNQLHAFTVDLVPE